MSDRVIYNSPNRITQHYKKGVHNGVDLGWSYDENANRVFSNCEGTVYATLDNIPHGSEKGGGWGNYVLIKHPNGMFSRYAHLKSGLMVKKGQKVTSDTQLGIMGDSGRATGRHLHYEVSTSSCTIDRINPEPYLTEYIYKPNNIKYRSHIENIGWQEWKTDGELSGTVGESKRLEALQIVALTEIYAKAHIQEVGWVDYGKINENTIIGTVGESKRLECLCLKGNFKYRVHIQDVGWSTWTDADGISTLGSVGQSLRIEGIEILSKE